MLDKFANSVEVDCTNIYIISLIFLIFDLVVGSYEIYKKFLRLGPPWYLSLKDFLLISCYNRVCKCIAKILANRSRNVLYHVAGLHQIVFIGGRRNGNNILLAHGINAWSAKCIPTSSFFLNSIHIWEETIIIKKILECEEVEMDYGIPISKLGLQDKKVWSHTK